MRPPEVFDQFPFLARLCGLLLGIPFAGLIANTFPERKGLAVIPIILGVVLFLARQVLVIDVNTGVWRYRRGVWPVMHSTVGTVDQLYGISIGVSRFERSSASRSNDGMFVSSYSATLYFQDDLLPSQSLYSGRDFGEVAEPAAILAHLLHLPMMLSHDLQWRSGDLAKYQAEAETIDG